MVSWSVPTCLWPMQHLMIECPVLSGDACGAKLSWLCSSPEASCPRWLACPGLEGGGPPRSSRLPLHCQSFTSAVFSVAGAAALQRGCSACGSVASPVLPMPCWAPFATSATRLFRVPFDHFWWHASIVCWGRLPWAAPWSLLLFVECVSHTDLEVLY